MGLVRSNLAVSLCIVLVASLQRFLLRLLLYPLLRQSTATQYSISHSAFCSSSGPDLCLFSAWIYFFFLPFLHLIMLRFPKRRLVLSCEHPNGTRRFSAAFSLRVLPLASGCPLLFCSIFSVFSYHHTAPQFAKRAYGSLRASLAKFYQYFSSVRLELV